MKNKAPGVLGRIAGALAPGREKISPVVWQPVNGRYPSLAGVDTRGLAGRSGLYLLWHLGVRPQWLRAGFSADLGAAAMLLAKTPEIAAFGPNDGSYFSWSFCAMQDAPARVAYLIKRLNPALQDLVLACDAIVASTVAAVPCALPPGTKDVQGALSIHVDRS